MKKNSGYFVSKQRHYVVCQKDKTKWRKAVKEEK
jgi:hypothetical protein